MRMSFPLVWRLHVVTHTQQLAMEKKAYLEFFFLKRNNKKRPRVSHEWTRHLIDQKPTPRSLSPAPATITNLVSAVETIQTKQNVAKSGQAIHKSSSRRTKIKPYHQTKWTQIATFERCKNRYIEITIHKRRNETFHEFVFLQRKSWMEFSMNIPATCNRSTTNRRGSLLNSFFGDWRSLN